MYLDSNLVFSNAQSLITNTSTGSSNIIDLIYGVVTGSTYISPPAMIIGQEAQFGEDLGTGDGKQRLKLFLAIGTAFATTNSATLQVAFQGAKDDAAGTVSGLTWTTYALSPAIAASALTANTLIPLFDWPQRPNGAALPRFHRLLYTLTGAVSFTAGTISAYAALQRDQFQAAIYGPGFLVGA